MRALALALLVLVGAGAAQAQQPRPAAPPPILTPATPPAPPPVAVPEKPLALRLESATTLRGPGGRWGVPVADELNRRLYLPRGPAGLSVLSLDTFKPLGEVPDTAGSGAVALDAETLRGFSANNLESKPGGPPGSGITVFDQRTYKPVGNLAVAASLVLYDVATRQLVAAVEGGEVVLIDPAKLVVIARMTLEGKRPSALAADRRGRVFVALADRDAIVVLDMVARRVATTWKPEGCRAPVGLVFDPFGQRLVVACRGGAAEGTTVAAAPAGLLVDISTGRPGASFQVPPLLDAVIHDAQNRLLYFTSGGNANVLVYRQPDAFRYLAMETVGTRPLAGLGVADGRTGRLILAAAEYVASVTQPDGSGGTRILPNSYTLLSLRRLPLE